MKIALVSLGCPKNQCDLDVITASLLEDGHEIVPALELAQLAIVNTCAFIDSAKQEAIDAVLDCCSYKDEIEGYKVMVTGCLAQRYGEEILKEIPEVDGVVGIGANADIAALVRRVAAGEKVLTTPPKENLPIAGPRIISTPRHYAYLKVAEGCSNRCHYCAIPLMRGRLRSRELEDVLQEAAWLAQQGVKEIIVVAQDTTAYGVDLYGEAKLQDLLAGLEEIDGIRWVRLLYTYPNRITDELLEMMPKCKKLLPYIDMPVQHINDTVLKNMNRQSDGAMIRAAVKRLREAVPGIALRTSLIAGFPGETEQQFEELYNFVKETGFERLGCFAYSQEEGTPAFAMPQLPQDVRETRAAAVMELQAGIMQQKQQALVGSEQLVICDGYSEEAGAYVCRTRFDAPEIDGVCYVSTGEMMETGEFYTVRIVDSDMYDLYAQYVEPA